jgi:hypothetical protein
MTRRTPLTRSVTLRRGVWTRRRTRKPHRYDSARCEAYLVYVRSLPCSVSGCSGVSQAAHTGPHGLGTKSPDWSAIPLCASHHLWEYDGSYHRMGRRGFEHRWKIDVDRITRRLVRDFLDEFPIRCDAECMAASTKTKKAGTPKSTGRTANATVKPATKKRAGRSAK